MYKSILTAAIATGLLANSPVAKADPNTDSLLTQVVKLASQGQDAATAAQITQYVQDHQDAITAILTVYMNYLKHIQTASTDDGTVNPQTAVVNAAPNDQGTTAQTNLLQLSGAPVTDSIQPASGPQLSSVQPSCGLQTSSVQPSGGLFTGHLAGYPSLPDIVPTSSVTVMSAAQTEYALKVKRENLARKAYLMQNPEGYTY
jgi:hypothetical protein